MDILSDILHSLHLSGSLWCQTEARVPWSMKLDSMDLAHFHYVVNGHCWFRMEAMAEPQHLSSGDLIVLPHGSAHSLSDHPLTKPVPITKWLETRKPHDKGPLIIGGNGPSTMLLCGYFHFEQGEVHPLFSILPQFIHIKAKQSEGVPWLKTTLKFIYDESRSEQPGAQTVITRLADILFIQVVRLYIDSMPEHSQGWLAALKNSQITKALEQIHRSPERAWTLGSLSSVSGMSRASFATKFKEVVGEPPFQYLTRWRMQKAATYLKDTNSSLYEIAERVGYGSEASFSRVFKRYFGTGPARYRKAARNNSYAPRLR